MLVLMKKSITELCVKKVEIVPLKSKISDDKNFCVGYDASKKIVVIIKYIGLSSYEFER